MIYRYLVENGQNITQEADKADFIIINSCGYHQQLRDASVALYEKYKIIKKPDAKIIMYGCLVKIDEELLKTLDLYPIGFDDGEILDNLFFKKKKFSEMTERCDSDTRNKISHTTDYLNFTRHSNFFLSTLFMPFSRKMKSKYNRFVFGIDHYNKILVEVSRGCLGNCHYCTIKKAKGNLKSRNIEAIISDIKSIYDSTKTLFLVADDCSSYGLDIGLNIFQLLKRIHQEFPNLEVQINYISPNLLAKFHNEYIELFKESPISYVTIPLQSGSNKIIKNMNRSYDALQVAEIIKEIKKISPKTLFEGHFIIGYPGENFIDFLKSVYITKYFDYPLAFIYSDTKGTKSYTLPNKKGYITKSFRLLIISAFINLVVFYKLAAK